MRMFTVLLAGMVLLPGCSTNMVKLGVYQNNAQLIGADGEVYAGSILIHEYTNDGDIVFETSPYGKLNGKWTATSASSTLRRIPAAEGQPAMEVTRRTYAGKSFLLANGKAVLNCDFKANIEGDMLLGGVFVIGDGICLDEGKQSIPIQFFKS